MKLASYIDHTLLKPDATTEAVEALCREAKEQQFHAVCVNGCHVPYAKALLLDTGVNVCTVIGFPLGAMATDAKIEEARTAIRQGADEIDMVINIAYLKEGRDLAVLKEISEIKRVCEDHVLKVILETGLLEPEEIKKGAALAVEAKADFVKTSTGFGPRGASLKDIELIKEAIGSKAKIKASGGIKDAKTAQAFIKAGAHRLGTSSGAKIVAQN
ncbi:deoxyribose-phosphate aldolase [Robertkochia aurantiaca]|uniref:deoxyribose-phosphate aldolase n=1 Tax=Robertkochia aurantiaca TaxID=2873700 RepID=UPI001CC98145|nr:deoxyribose-phosphate aldolase [Robertkochia sp. 3YJGBD-33]